MQDSNDISILIQQNKLLLEMMCGLQNEINDLNAKVNNIHRAFFTSTVEIEKPLKKLSITKQRTKNIEDRKNKERLEMMQKIKEQLNQN